MDTLTIQNALDLREGIQPISYPTNVDMGIITDEPFKCEIVILTPNYKEIDASIYCSNSDSLPESNLIDNNYVKLKPTWCFYDKNLNKVYENIKIDYHTELINSDGEVIGGKGDLVFYFRDDLPSKVGFPTMLHISLNLFNYKNKNNVLSNEYVENNYYNSKFKVISPLTIYELTPAFLRFTTNGYLDFATIQYPKVELKSYVTINGLPRAKYIKDDACGDSFPIMYNYPKYDSNGDTNKLEFSLTPLQGAEVIYPEGTTIDFPKYTMQGKDVSGGWVDVSAIPEVLSDNAEFYGEMTLDVEITGATGGEEGNYNYLQRFYRQQGDGYGIKFQTPSFDTSNPEVVEFIETYGEYILANNVSEISKFYWKYPTLESYAEEIIKTENCVGGIVVDNNGNIWASSFQDDHVYVQNPDGHTIINFNIKDYAALYPNEIIPNRSMFGDWYGANKLTKDYEGNIWLSLYNCMVAIKFNPDTLSIEKHISLHWYYEGHNNLPQGAVSFYPLKNDRIIFQRNHMDGSDEFQMCRSTIYSHVSGGGDNYYSPDYTMGRIADFGDSDVEISDDGTLLKMVNMTSKKPGANCNMWLDYHNSENNKYITAIFYYPSPSDPDVITTPFRVFLIPNSSKALIISTNGLYLTEELDECEPITGPDNIDVMYEGEHYERYFPPFMDDYLLSAWIDDKFVLNIVYGHEENGKLVSNAIYRGRINKDIKLKDIVFTKMELESGVDSPFSFSDQPYVEIGTQSSSTGYQNSIETIKGSSTSFSIENFEDSKYDLRNVNESWDMYEQYMSYIKQEYLLEFKALWEDFMKHILGTDDSSYQTIGRQFYDKISNFVLYNSDISTANVKQLGSLLASMALSVGISTEDMPATLEYWMNKLSVQFTKLMGEDINCDRNFVFPKYEHSQPCPACGKIHKSNMGNKIDNPVLEIGTPIVIRDTYNNITPFELFYPNVSGDIKQLEDFGFNAPFESNYEVYEYVSSASTPSQSEGLLNRYDEHNTLDVKNVDYYEWWKDGGHIDKIYYNALYDGFDLDKGDYVTEEAQNVLLKNEIEGYDLYLIDDDEAISVGVIPFKLDKCSKATKHFVKLYQLSTFYSEAPSVDSLDIIDEDIDSSSMTLYNIPIPNGRMNMTTLYSRIPEEVYVLDPDNDGVYLSGMIVRDNEAIYTSNGFIAINYNNTTYGIPVYI